MATRQRIKDTNDLLFAREVIDNAFDADLAVGSALQLDRHPDVRTDHLKLRKDGHFQFGEVQIRRRQTGFSEGRR